MKDFIYGLYKNDNFTLILTIILVILVVLFFIVLFFGKKDQKLEETKRLQKIELEKKLKEEPKKEENEIKVLEEPKKEEPQEEVKEDVRVIEFTPDVFLEDDEVIDIPLVKEKENAVPLFSEYSDEDKPINFDELEKIDSNIKTNLDELENIKSEFASIELPKLEEEKKDVEEPKIFKPSPVFSSVFVNKNEDIKTNEEEKVTKIIEEKEEVKEAISPAKLFSIEDDEEEMELPTLKKDDDKTILIEE